jgi:hypothetical protein
MIKLLTPVFRVSFPQVFEARAMQPGQEAKYSITMLFDLNKIKSTATEKKLWDDMLASVKIVAQEKFPKGIPPGFKNPFRDGVEKEQYEGYGKGVVFVAATTKTRPGVVDQNLQKIISPDEFYPGVYARATLNPFAWMKLGKTGVSFGLQNIQKVKDGDPLGGRTRAEDDFDALGDLALSGDDQGAEKEDDPTAMFQ